jgi:hypothetical protein
VEIGEGRAAGVTESGSFWVGDKFTAYRGATGSSKMQGIFVSGFAESSNLHMPPCLWYLRANCTSKKALGVSLVSTMSDIYVNLCFVFEDWSTVQISLLANFPKEKQLAK